MRRNCLSSTLCGASAAPAVGSRTMMTFDECFRICTCFLRVMQFCLPHLRFVLCQRNFSASRFIEGILSDFFFTQRALHLHRDMTMWWWVHYLPWPRERARRSVSISPLIACSVHSQDIAAVRAAAFCLFCMSLSTLHAENTHAVPYIFGMEEPVPVKDGQCHWVTITHDWWRQSKFAERWWVAGAPSHTPHSNNPVHGRSTCFNSLVWPASSLPSSIVLFLVRENLRVQCLVAQHGRCAFFIPHHRPAHTDEMTRWIMSNELPSWKI